jgi:hypothetical protein
MLGFVVIRIYLTIAKKKVPVIATNNPTAAIIPALAFSSDPVFGWKLENDSERTTRQPQAEAQSQISEFILVQPGKLSMLSQVQVSSFKPTQSHARLGTGPWLAAEYLALLAMLSGGSKRPLAAANTKRRLITTSSLTCSATGNNTDLRLPSDEIGPPGPADFDPPSRTLALVLPISLLLPCPQEI